MPDLTAGYTYNDDDKKEVTDGNLNALIGNATINTGVVTAAKLAAGSVTNAKVDTTAAIAHSKLANLTDSYVLVGNGSNVPTAVDVTGDVKITNAGVTAIQADAVETAMIEDGAVTAAKLDSGAAAPTGAIMQFAAAVAPSGWLLCDGDATLNTYTYRVLHAVISNTYGGTAYDAGTTDDSGAVTEFALPNFKGRLPIGVGQGETVLDDDDAPDTGTNRALAAIGGYETHKLTDKQLGAHQHYTSTTNNAGVTGTKPVGESQIITFNQGGGPGGNVNNEYYLCGSSSFSNYIGRTSESGEMPVATTGDDDAHENMSPFLVVNFIIKT